MQYFCLHGLLDAVMRILVDGSALSSQYGNGGVGRYVRSLLSGISSAGLGQLVDIFLSAPDVPLADETDFGAVFRSSAGRYVTGRARAIATQQVALRRRARGYDLLLSPVVSYDVGAPTVLLFPPVRQAIIVHDLIPLHMRDHFLTSRRRRFWFDRALNEIQRSPLLITDSDHVALDITQFLGVKESRIRVVRPAPHAMLQVDNTSRSSSALVRGQSVGPFVLGFAGTNPSKNMQLLRSVARLLHDRFSKPVMILVGAEIGASGWGRAVLSAPGVSDDELARLMHAAKCVLVPSFFEGFGYPVVEAMAMATPVLALDAPWSAELVSDSRCRLPNDAALWARTIEDLLTTTRPLTPSKLPEALSGRTPQDFACDMMETLSVADV